MAIDLFANNISEDSALVFWGEIYVRPESLGGLFTPDEAFGAPTNDQYITLASPIMGDRYSARNWVFQRLRDAFFRGGSINDFVEGSPFGFFAVQEAEIQKDQFDRMVGKNPINDEVYERPISGDIQFSVQFGEHAYRPNKSAGYVFKRPVFLDRCFDERSGAGPGLGKVGPQDPPFRLFPETDREWMMQHIEAVTSEATLYKEWTIPNGAIVENDTAEFGTVQLFEEDNSVAFVFRDGFKYFCLGYDGENETWDDTHVRLDDEHPEFSAELEADHKLAIKFIGALLLHDFWVTEYRARDNILTPARPRYSSKSYPWASPGEDGRILIYMPRVRYVGGKQYQEQSNKTEFTSRRAGRSCHVRNLTKCGKRPSPGQLLLAEQYGVRVPKGYTFVKPSKPSSEDENFEEELKVYRSRSAIEALCDVQIQDKRPARVKWAEFEEDTKSWLSSLGLVIIPHRWRKRGDGGIDAAAIQTKGKKYVLWCVQCKCWSRNRCVDLTVVRDLIGAIEVLRAEQDAEYEIRGMIVTTSRFSEGRDFQDVVDKHAIVLVDGDGFVSGKVPEGFS